MDVQNRPDLVTGLRVARFVNSIVRDASAADLLAGAVQNSRAIADTTNAIIASRPHGVSRVNKPVDGFAIPFWQWEEQSNRRLAELANINGGASIQRANGAASSDGRSAIAAQAAEIAYSIRRTVESGARSGSPRLGEVSSVRQPVPVVRPRIVPVYRAFAPAGNLVDLIA